MTGIYFRFLTKSKFRHSNKSNIHLLAICKSSFFKVYSSDICIFLSNEISKINQNTTSVKYGDSIEKFSFVVPFFSLDSKAASFLLGFKNSFNHNYVCRFCLTSINEFKSTFLENNVELRSDEIYTNDYDNVPFLSEGKDFHGLTRTSPLFNFGVPHFHLIAPPCIAHDVFEGVCVKITKLPLKYFLKRKIFKTSCFKFFFHQLDLKGTDKSSFPFINLDNIDSIRFTFHESITFYRFYLFFISEHYEFSDPVFCLVKVLTTIVNILMQFSIRRDSLLML